MSHLLNTTLLNFKPISLHEMDCVMLMNRVDKKFWMDMCHLEQILGELTNSYWILEDDEERSIKYKSTYYDTLDDMLYMHHHNGESNRYKVRKRKYVKSNRNYMEIKFKTAEGRTIKERIITGDRHHHFTKEESAFIEQLTLQSANAFVPSLESKFQRITLVNKLLPERVTIDVKPEFKTKEGKLKLHNLVIIEVKSDAHNTDSLMVKKLSEQGITKTGFSKYCIGRALLDPTLKQNQFESKIGRLVAKILVEIIPEEQLVLDAN